MTTRTAYAASVASAEQTKAATIFNAEATRQETVNVSGCDTRAAARTQRRSSAKWRCGVPSMPKFAKLTEQSN
jgi:hypothetical protein